MPIFFNQEDKIFQIRGVTERYLRITEVDTVYDRKWLGVAEVARD